MTFLYILLKFAGSEFSEDKFIAKVKMEIVVKKDQVRIWFKKLELLKRTSSLNHYFFFFLIAGGICNQHHN